MYYTWLWFAAVAAKDKPQRLQRFLTKAEG